jgi:hypothetical protein
MKQMKQFCIRVDQKTAEKIEQRAEEKVLKLSEYLRRLIELGLRIEQMSEKKENPDSDEPFADLGSSKLLWEKERLYEDLSGTGKVKTFNDSGFDFLISAKEKEKEEKIKTKLNNKLCEAAHYGDAKLKQVQSCIVSNSPRIAVKNG